MGSDVPHVQALELAAASARPQEHLAPLVLAHCWLDSALESDLRVPLRVGQSLRSAFAEAGLRGFGPDWLYEAGYRAADAGGTVLESVDDSAHTAGATVWMPFVPLHRVDDQVNEKIHAPGSSDRNRRLAGEVLLTCLWKRDAMAAGVDETSVARGLTGNGRGARFRFDIQSFLSASLPGWEFPHEKPLSAIYGLHLRGDVGQRKSDILALDDTAPRRRAMAVISSKWTWRSDRGTEAAQMVPLRRYRPDLPYVIVTAEFPRARIVGRESVEDRAYHLSPEWVAAWLALNQEWNMESWAGLSLDDALGRGAAYLDGLGLGSLPDLADALRTAGQYG